MKSHPLYQELVLDHARHPRHMVLLDDFTHEAICHNPSCGDRLTLQASIDGHGHIQRFGWSGQGCALCLSSASLLADWLHTQENRHLSHLLECALHNKRFLMEAHQTPYFKKYEVYQQIYTYPSRVKCAALALEGALSFRS